MKNTLRYVPTAFISGTFADMVEWRESARETLEKVQVFAIDLARSASVHQPIRDYINIDLDDAHLLVGIYGIRYGSLVNGSNAPPSWSHHEYTRHCRRASLYQGEPNRPETLILLPKKGSDAFEKARQAAKRVYDELGMTEEQRSQDTEYQQRFINVVAGREPDFAINADDSAPVKVDLVLQSKLLAYFSDAGQLKEEILAHLHKVGFARSFTMTVPEPAAHVSNVASPPPAKLTSATLARLSPKPQPAGLCVVIPKIDGTSSQLVAEGVAQANPWNVAEANEFLDLAGEAKPQLLEIMRAFAYQRFGVTGTDFATLAASIAKVVAGFEEPDMFRIDNVPRGLVFDFLNEVWPVFEMHLRSEREKSGNERAGLLLILSCNAAPSMLRAYCQMAGDSARPHTMPILLEATSLASNGAGPSDNATTPGGPMR